MKTKEKDSVLLSTEQVKKELGVNDFKHFPDDKLDDFVSLIPRMIPEDAVECYKQFPHFRDLAAIVNDAIRESYLATLAQNGKIADQIIKDYERILDNLDQELRRPFVFRKRREAIIEKQLQIMNEMVAYDAANKKHISDMFVNALKAGLAILSLGVAVLGRFRKDDEV